MYIFLEPEYDIVIGEYVDFPLVIQSLKELIDKDDEKYKEFNERLNQIEINLENKNKEKNNIEINNNLIKEKEEILKVLETLLSQREEFEIKEKDIINAKNAKEVKYIEDNLIDNKNKLEQRNKDLNINIEAVNKLKEDEKLSIEKLNIEESKESEREKLSVEIENLKLIEPKILEFDKLTKEIVTLNKEINAIISNIKNNKDLVEKLKIEKIDVENQLKEIALLETKKVELQSEIKNKNKLISETRELFKSIQMLEKNRKNHFDLSKDYEEFEKIYSKSKNTYEQMDDLYKKEQAGILATSLKENSACPVCGSTNHPNPAIIRNDVCIPTKEELKNKKDELDKLDLSKIEKINELTKMKESIDTYQVFVNNSLDKFSKDINIDVKYSQDTQNQVMQVGTQLKDVIEKLQKELIKVNEKVEQKDYLNKKIKNIDDSILNNEKELSNLDEKEKKYLREISSINTKIESYKKDIPEDIKDVDTLNKLVDVKNKELNESKQRVITLRNKKEEISKKLEANSATINEINKSIEILNKELSKITSEFEANIKAKGFTQVSIYEEAKLKISFIEKFEEEVSNYKNKLNIFNSKKDDILNKTKDLLLVDTITIDEEIKNIIESKKQVEKDIKEKYLELGSNKTILKNVENLNNKFKALEEEYKIVGELADLANGKKSPYISFERYILASYFEDIIDAANIRLLKMTGERFSLTRKKSKSKGAGQKGLELEIYDNYTDSSRDVSSLSGGESFKASLSLALGLSDIIQSSTGGVVVDTMFVDEGFGTLDPQSLDSAIDSLLELQRGGRLVGIISHVEELKERMDAKLEVESTSKGSKAKFNIL